ncbi:hypothetical protein MRAB57_1829 [Mycobacterium rhizamassiliense]|jgi:hypothetical protein|uniref:Uncharacterized protein n=1 Tax=Mycobacterium rhizamassiliense TaxID=1841860 RepID=A0A2U3NR70_9MYCO|nr:hypothetical protein [Mycobacterium rhizamassiliense]SPM34018.1 hypothetical protein MRAB57_1829 [Mycobacterium rhizamassiliense]
MLRTINGHYPIGEAVWVVAGFIVLMTFGDAVVVLALAIAAAALTATWWIRRKAEHRVAASGAIPASVTQLHPELTHAHHLRGPRAA